MNRSAHASPPLDSGHYSTALFVDPRLGPIAIGWHSQIERLRAVALPSGRVGWDAPPNVVADPARRALAIAAGRVYVANAWTLSAVDLYTGALLWQVQLEHEVQTGFGRPCLADPYPPNAPGVVVVQLANEQFVALDRFTGAAVWTLPGATYFGPFAIPYGVVLNATHEGQLKTLFIDPARGPVPFCALPCPYGLLRVEGGNTVVVGSSDIDGVGTPGVAVVEVPSGRVLLNTPAPFDERRGAPVVAGRFVYSADLIELAGSPNGPRAQMDLVPGHVIDRLESTGRTLLGLFDTERGESHLRLCGFDPKTLAPRYGSSVELGARVKLADGMNCLARMDSLALVAGAVADEQGRAAVQLSALDAETGTPRFRHIVPGALEHLDASQGTIRLRTDERTWLFPPTGAPALVAYPAP